MFVIKFLTTGNATSASSKAKLISFNPESTCSSVKEGALLSLENIFSNLFVKFSNIFKHPTPIALVGEPSLTSVDTLIKRVPQRHVYLRKEQANYNLGF